jgi:uncharacterized small protein (DUF1192 family)
MKSNEVLTGLIAVKELQIKTLQERVNWLQSVNQNLANELAVLEQEITRLYSLEDKKKETHIGFK